MIEQEENLALKRMAGLIRRQRRIHQLTQAELAGLAGVGLRFVSDLENAKPGLEVGRVLKVLETIGLDLAVAPRRWPSPP